MVDEYDAAVEKLAKLKSEYADHVEVQRQRRKPALYVLAGGCILVIAWLVFSSGGVGIPAALALIACGVFYKAYQLWGRAA